MAPAHRNPLLPLALALAITALAPAMAVADAAPKRPPQVSDEMIAAGFLEGHPDLKWRRQAILDKDAGRADDAFVHFQRAARYADKPSAAMVAEMYWTGDGVAQDRALGYVWMDLAAERMWRPFLAKREAYWTALTAEERTRALAIGAPIYDEYGDAVAKERKEKAMNRAKRQMTGSRVGFVGALTIEIPGAAGNIRIRGDQFYSPTFWNADRYWAWQEDTWKEARPGVVSVGPVSDANAAPAAPQQGEDEGGGEGRPR